MQVITPDSPAYKIVRLFSVLVVMAVVLSCVMFFRVKYGYAQDWTNGQFVGRVTKVSQNEITLINRRGIVKQAQIVMGSHTRALETIHTGDLLMVSGERSADPNSLIVHSIRVLRKGVR